ncbi:MAG: heterodisulfide reductase-related iron-sulfur binding cluster [Planctomycetota bacterium]|jgi:Fe-S oxidoreductase
MSPIFMTLALAASLALFAYSAARRWRLMRIGPADLCFDNLGERISRTLRFAFGQARMPRYKGAGLAHIMIFFGFLVLLLRSWILFARGYTDNPHFGYWIFALGTPLGNLYSLVKDIFIALVIMGTLVFLYYRLINKQKRMSHSGEGVLILGIIFVMMVADMIYDGANIVLHGEGPSLWEPLGSTLAGWFGGASQGTLTFLLHLGFWTHACLVLIFLNILPYTKHFHVITAIPNVFLQPLGPAGRLPKMDDIEGMVEREETLGIKRIDQFGQKAMLDFYTCTECGRCTDFCPANKTGKLLSPKQLSIDLRNFLYEHQTPLTAGNRSSSNNGDGEPAGHRIDLVGEVVKPEVLWACTTCRACEQECPVFISYVDKIVHMRRYLVQEGGEFPEQLQTAFRGMETTGSPYNLPADDRMQWAEGLDVPLMSDQPDAEVLFWVGCAPAFDDRAKKVARATARLMQIAGVKFACLGPEEQCTGDAARRAGNEFLFQTMAQMNIEVLDGYHVKRIVTVCPHCYNTLGHEYSDFGGRYEVISHADFLADLVRRGRLRPTGRVEATVTYHDSCYLGRYNEIYDSPRQTLACIPGVRLLEPAETRDRGMCCGAGGGQMWKEEESGDTKVSFARTNQLIETGAGVIASACPFCMRMLTDGINLQDHEGVLQSVEGAATEAEHAGAVSGEAVA